MVNRPCLSCGRLSPNTRCARCAPAHARAREANRKPRPTTITRDWTERQRRATAVAQHRATYGEWCPGWADRPAHYVTPPNLLTADHDHSIGRGGDPRGLLVVRCRVCNGAKS